MTLHAPCGGCVGLLLGGLDALFASTAERSPLPLVRLFCVGAGIGGTFGFLAGTVLGLVGALLQSPLLGRVSRFLPPPSPAGKSVRNFLAGAVGFACFVYPLHVSARIQVPSLRATVLGLGAAGSIAAALQVSSWLDALARRPETPRRPRPRLEWLMTPGPRFAIARALPVLLASVPLLMHFGNELGWLRRSVVAAVFWTLERTVVLSLRTRRRQGASHAPMLLLPLCVAMGQLPVRPSEASRLTEALFVPDATEVLRRLTDFDRDGFSSLFGGRDCAPFDRSRSPGADDSPGNGIDEDCDGSDLAKESSPAAVLPKFSARPNPLGAPFNVLWYVVDSLRRDHLKTYGYAFDTAPTLTALANEAWVFDDALSQSSTTALSVPSMLAGRNPSAMQWTRGTYPVAVVDGPVIPTVFREHRYFTALFTNAWVHEILPGLRVGFEHALVAAPDVSWRSGDQLVSHLFEAVARARSAGQPFFVVAHVDDVHHPYSAAQGKAVPTFAAPGEQAAYDAGIAVFDQGLRATIAHLQRIGAWDHTVLIVTADHGEEFGEHGGSVHSRTCYAESTRVPLVVRVPHTEAKRVPSPVALIDLAPTLLELLGAREAGHRLDGQSLLVPVYEPAAVAENRPIFCTICQVLAGRPAFFTRAVRQGKWSLFEDVLNQHVELYDRHHDPGERVDLGARPEWKGVAANLRQSLSSAEGGNLLRLSRGLD